MATNQDVAKLAGVSPATVSRVLNESGYVAAEVRERVNKAIAELNYVPNRVARSLRMQQCRQFACIMPSVSNPFYHEIVTGIEETALENGYTFSIYNLITKKREYMRVILEGFYDGLIFLSPFEVERVYDISEIARQIPTSVYSDRATKFDLPNVRVDLRKAMETNVSYMIQSGHRDIMFLGYEFTNPSENPRYEGYANAMTAHGLEIKPSLVQLIPDLKDTLSEGYELIKQLIADGHQFTAIAASNDLLAVGSMRALTEHGMKVPDDVSVTGVDDIELARLITPTLTTARVPKKEIGKILVNMLLEQIDGGNPSAKSIHVDTELIIRESTGRRK